MKISENLSDKIQKTIDECAADAELFLIIGGETSENLDFR